MSEIPSFESNNNYNRHSIVRRLDTVSGRGRTYLESALDKYGYSYDQVKDWMLDTNMLTDEDVEGFARELAQLIAELGLLENETPDDLVTIKAAANKIADIIENKFA